MALRYHPRTRHARAPSGSSTATAATGISNASTAIAQVPPTTATETTSSTPTDYRPHPNIRRNLFAQHVSRRVASGASRSRMAEQASHGNDIIGGGDGVGSAGLLRTTSSTSLSSKSAPTTAISLSTAPVDNDIVARDRNGQYQVDVPMLPPTDEDGEDDTSDPMEGIEGADTGHDVTGVDVGEEDIDSLNQEKLDESIKELMRRHRNRQANGEQSEVYLLIQQSLANKVASLDEDNWMYEVEDEFRI